MKKLIRAIRVKVLKSRLSNARLSANSRFNLVMTENGNFMYITFDYTRVSGLYNISDAATVVRLLNTLRNAYINDYLRG